MVLWVPLQGRTHRISSRGSPAPRRGELLKMVVEERILRRYLSILFVISLLSMTGCATTDDLRRVHSDLNRQIQVTNEKIASVEQGFAPLREEIAGVRSEIAKTTQEAIQPLRSSQAEGRAEMTDIREQLQQIRGTTDGLRKDLSSASARDGQAGGRGEGAPGEVG